jgi:hypothetical protein
MTNRNSSVGARGKIYVVNADGHVRDDLQIRSLTQQRVVDGVRQHRVHANGIRDLARKDIRWNRPILRPHPHIRDLSNPLDGIPGWATCDDDL